MIGYLDDEWTNLFHNFDGWTGADGIYSIPLDGNDNLSSALDTTKTLIVFSDTLIGKCDLNSHHYTKGPIMIHNSAANLLGKLPQTNKRQFIYGNGGDMTNTTLFGYKCWLSDGIAINGMIYIISFTFLDDMNPSRTDMIRIPIGTDGWPNYQSYTIENDIPLFYNTSTHLITFGAAITDNTNIDGYVYIYGIRNRLQGAFKQMLVARVEKSNYHNYSLWKFYCNKEWVSGIHNCDNDNSAIYDHVSPELSVTRLTSGSYQNKYILIFEKDTMSNYLQYAIGESPISFGNPITFYTTPIPSYASSAFSYNAKAHPHLSAPGTLLISYNVNLFAEFPYDNDIYRPRFIRLVLK